MFSHEDGLFEVRTPINPNYAYRGNHHHEVNLRQSTCSCQKWQDYKILCSHVIAVCKYQGISAMWYINRCYHLEEQVACYAPRFRMVPDSVHWNEPNVKLRYEKCRPRSTRLRNEMDLGTKHQPRPLCNLCRQEGHNKRICPTRTVAGSTSGQIKWPNISIQSTSVDWLDNFFFFFKELDHIVSLYYLIEQVSINSICYDVFYHCKLDWGVRLFILCLCVWVYIYSVCAL